LMEITPGVQAQPGASPSMCKPIHVQAQPGASPTRRKPNQAQAQPGASPTRRKSIQAQAHPGAKPNYRAWRVRRNPAVRTGLGPASVAGARARVPARRAPAAARATGPVHPPPPRPPPSDVHRQQRRRLL